MPTIPAALRAYLGLLDATVHRARDLAEHAPELPMQVVGNALQLSMKAQQRFTDLTIRGDELIGRLRGVPDEPPAWATFDDDLAGSGEPAASPSPLEILDGVEEPEDADAEAPVPELELETVPPLVPPARKASAPRTAAKAATKAPKKAPATKAPAKKTPATKAPAKKAPATKAPAKKALARSLAADLIADGASVQTPGSARQLSAFDLAADPGVDRTD